MKLRQQVLNALLSLPLLIAQPASAANLIDEGFEYSDNAQWLSNWGASSCTASEHTGIMEISSQRTFGGSKKSLKMTYVGHDPAKTCFLDKKFNATVDTVYTRIYMFLDNFKASDINTKIFTNSMVKRYPNFWWSLVGPTNTHRVAIEGTTLGSDANIQGGTIPSGRWVCLETRVSLNTPGVANGIIQSWVDGAPRINRNDLLLRQGTEKYINGQLPDANFNGPNSHLEYTRFYRQHGLGTIYYDSFAVSKARIGCTGATLPPPIPVADVVVEKLDYLNGKFTAIVKNQGNAPTASGFNVGFFVNNVLKANGNVSISLAAGATVSVSANYLLANGFYTIMANADNLNVINESDNSNNQFFKVITIGPTALFSSPTRLKAEHSGKCLDSGASSANSVAAYQYDCFSVKNQTYDLHDKGGGYYEIASQFSGKCLDIIRSDTTNGAAIIQYTCSGTPNQLFRFEAMGGGKYRIVSKLNNKKCIDIYKGSTANVAKVEIWDCHGGPNQNFFPVK